MTEREALKLALEALEISDEFVPVQEAITAIKEALEQPAQKESVRLRRGDILRCIETDELCTVWSTSTTGRTLIKWSEGSFGNYTAEQIGDLFWLEPEPDDLELAAEKSDNYAAFHAGYRFAVARSLAEQPAQQETSNESAYQRGYLDGMAKPCVECADRKLKEMAEQSAQQQEPVAWKEAILGAISCDVGVEVPIRDYKSMNPLDCYEAGLLDGGEAVRKTIKDEVTKSLAFYSEPVAWGHPNTSITGRKQALMMVALEIPSNAQYPQMWLPLYTTPPHRKPLTDEEIWLEYQRFWPFHPAEEPRLAKDIAKFARAIEAKLKEKNT